jgi:hypothetical protein
MTDVKNRRQMTDERMLSMRSAILLRYILVFAALFYQGCWYSARNGPLSPRIERGPLDGVTVRVSLDDDGRPFMVDIMNNCGCYHIFVPDRQKVVRSIPLADELDAFVSLDDADHFDKNFEFK